MQLQQETLTYFELTQLICLKLIKVLLQPSRGLRGCSFPLPPALTSDFYCTLTKWWAICCQCFFQVFSTSPFWKLSLLVSVIGDNSLACCCLRHKQLEISSSVTLWLSRMRARLHTTTWWLGLAVFWVFSYCDKKKPRTNKKTPTKPENQTNKKPKPDLRMY